MPARVRLCEGEVLLRVTIQGDHLVGDILWVTHRNMSEAGVLAFFGLPSDAWCLQRAGRNWPLGASLHEWLIISIGPGPDRPVQLDALRRPPRRQTDLD